MACMQELHLPQNNDGLGWIARHSPARLSLAPEIHAAHIIAAAAGNHSALAHLIAVAQKHAATDEQSTQQLFARFCQSSLASLTSHLTHGTLQNESCLKVQFEARQQHTKQTLIQVVEHGQLAALRWLQALCHSIPGAHTEMIMQAISNDDVLLLQHLHPHPQQDLQNLDIMIAATSSIKCLEYLIEHGSPGRLDHEVVRYAACNSKFDAIKTLQQHGRIEAAAWHNFVIPEAVRSGSISLVSDLRASSPLSSWEGWRASCLRVAAGRDDLPMMQWLRAQNPPCPWTAQSHLGSLALTTAMRYNGDQLLQEEILRWAVTAGYQLDQDDLGWAARHGNLTLLQFLHANHSDHASFGCAAREACAAGRFDILRWIDSFTPASRWWPACPALAAAAGRLDILQWLREQEPPCEWNDSTTIDAAGAGHVEVLAWAIDRGCEVDADRTYGAAIEGRHLYVLAYLHAIGIQADDPLYYTDLDLMTRVFGESGKCLRTPILLFLGDIGLSLDDKLLEDLKSARSACCIFHGLLRWCRKAIMDRSNAFDSAFDCLAEDSSGQELLVQLSLLPAELISKIAHIAELQYDLTCDSL